MPLGLQGEVDGQPEGDENLNLMCSALHISDRRDGVR